MMLPFKLFLVVVTCVKINYASNCEAPPSPVQNNCSPQMFDQDSVVCVCDKNYCDSLIADEFPEPGQYTLITSDKAGKRFFTETRETEPLDYNVQDQCYSILTNQTVYLKVDKEQKQQTILGFGGAFTDAVGYNLNKLCPDLVDHIFNSYFAQDGLRYNMARTSCGHTDFSDAPYYYVDTDDIDINMTTFKIADADYKYRIPYIKRAKEMAKEELLLVSSLWTTPSWMRRDNDDNKRVIVSEKYYESFCLYIMKYLEAYAKEDLEHYAITFANEPTITLGIELNEHEEEIMTVWTLDRLIKFAQKYFMPALSEKFSKTKMLFFDDNRNIILKSWLKVEEKYKSFNENLELAGFHSYFDSFIDPSVLDSFHQKHPNVTILTTELSIGKPGNLGSWSYAEFYASSYLQELNHFTSGWIDWNLLLDTKSQPSFVNTPDNAPILVDTEKQEIYKQPSFYGIGHFSKFIHRGSRKIGLVSQFATDLEYACVQRPDGYMVAVMQNKSNNTMNVNIVNGNNIISITATPHSISTAIFS